MKEYSIYKLLIISRLIYYCHARTYTFGEDCSVFLEDIDEYDTIYVRYDGGEVSMFCNDISFDGRGNDILDEYKVCVTPEYFEDPDCAIEIEYTNTASGTPFETYTCNNPPTSKYCGEEEDYFYIYLNSIKTDKSNSRFQLKVEAVKTYDYSTSVAIIAACAIGGIVVLCFCIFGILCFVRKRQGFRGQVVSPTSRGTVPMTQFNQQAAGYPTQQYRMNQPNIQPTQPTGRYPTQPTGSHPT